MFQSKAWASTRLLPLAVASVLLFPPSAHAQVSAAGLKIGAVQSSMAFFFGRCPPDAGRGCAESAQPNQPRRSVALGAFARIDLHDRISIQPELLYIRKGYEVTGPTLHFSYVEAPVLLRGEMREREARGLRPYLYGGPAPAFMVGCTVLGTTGDGPYRERCDGAEPPQTPGAPSRYDLGLVIGGGIAFGAFEVAVRHARSLVDIGAWESAERTTNRALTVLLGYGVAVDR